MMKNHRTERMNDTTLKKISADLNNHAVVLIRGKKYNGAIKTLCKALEKYRILISSQSLSENDESMSNISLHTCVQQSEYIQQQTHILQDEANDQSLYIHRQPLCIPKGLGKNYEEITMASALVIFNLALAHQLLAEEESMDGQSRRKLLKKAGKLFQCALNMSIDEELDSSSFSFTLAAMNNMGIIYYQLDENEAATNCFERLMSIIVYLHGSSFDASHYVGNACAFISNNSGDKLQKNDRLAAAA